jgi:hypothetical protein
VTITCDVTTGTAYDAAIEAAAVGSKAAAGAASVRASIGEDFVVKCWHSVTVTGDEVEDALIFEAAFAGLIPLVSGDVLEITGPGLSGAFAAASSLDTPGICRIESATGTRHIQGTFGLAGTDFTCTGPMEDGDTDVGTITLRFSPSLDAAGTVDEDEQSVVDDMLDSNDAAAFGVAFRDSWNAEPGTGTAPGAVVMGVLPRGNNNEAWFTSDATIPAAYRNADKWRYFIPFLNVMEAEEGAGTGHTAANAALRIWNQQIMLRNTATGVWSQFALGQTAAWSRASKSTIGQIAGAVSARASPMGGTEVRYPAGPLSYVLQATWNGLQLLNVDAYDAIQHTFWAELMKWDAAGVDDLADASLLIQVGASWYPTSRGGLDLQTIPGCFISRQKFVTDTPKRFSAITLLEARQANVEANGISAADYLADPPVLL